MGGSVVQRNLGFDPNASTTTASASTSTTSDRASPYSSPFLLPSGNNAIYLYSFPLIATVLIALSFFLIVRAFVLRRRLRRRIDEAIAAGFIHPDQIEAIRRGRRIPPSPLENPKMWEVWMGGSADEKGGWNDILPLSATILPSDSPPPIHPQRSRRPFSFIRRANPPRPPSDPNPTPDQLQIAVFISLPHPHFSYKEVDIGSSKGKDVDRDEDFPLGEVVFGVTEVPWTGGNVRDLEREAVGEKL